MDQTPEFKPQLKQVTFPVPNQLSLLYFIGSIRSALNDAKRMFEFAKLSEDHETADAICEVVSTLQFLDQTLRQVLEAENEEEAAFYANQEEAADPNTVGVKITDSKS